MMQQLDVRKWKSARARLPKNFISATAGGTAIKVTMTGGQEAGNPSKSLRLSQRRRMQKCFENAVLSTLLTLRCVESLALQERLIGPLAGRLPFKFECSTFQRPTFNLSNGVTHAAPGSIQNLFDRQSNACQALGQSLLHGLAFSIYIGYALGDLSTALADLKM
ncbi:hypothetical protein [Candidatus Villigracilis affinis]|uniref:hypothetical protein n=1 Tax=Candidatus Villigracilis affinis TaxID=3140682 RepID=UPI002A1ADA8B|nr:hypothetical protein [Anaerolineales bacterium]